MDTLIKTTEEQDFEDALSSTPEEVQSFMWGDEFNNILDASQKILSLSDTEKEIMRTSSYDLILQISDFDKVIKNMHSANIAPEKISKILSVIQKMYLEPASAIALESIELEDEEPTTIDSIENAPSPADIIARMQNTLTKPSAIAPVTRDYSNVNIEKEHAPAPSIRNIDPYRELPNEKE